MYLFFKNIHKSIDVSVKGKVATFNKDGIKIDLFCQNDNIILTIDGLNSCSYSTKGYRNLAAMITDLVNHKFNLLSRRN